MLSGRRFDPRNDITKLVDTLRSNGVEVSDACFGEREERGHQVVLGTLCRGHRGYVWVDLIENEQFPQLQEAIDRFNEKNFYPWALYPIDGRGRKEHRLYQPAGTLEQQQESILPLAESVRDYFK
jgi:hypothetical protein